MSRTSALMAVVTREPASTSDLYDRVGYVALAQLGLIPYHAFRAELAALAATGSIYSETAPDGSTIWRLPSEDEPTDGPILG
ncbi:MAG: hypothetical protein JO027_20290 [Solirubrobacterales bacterium]|nr:hypothetical protein [Solirubrobacterales bacterium]